MSVAFENKMLKNSQVVELTLLYRPISGNRCFDQMFFFHILKLPVWHVRV